MEFTGGGLLEVRITPSDVGKRVSVRRLIDGGESAGKFTDTVGVLTSWTSGVLRVTRRNGEAVEIDERALVAGKVVPAAPARRRGPAADFAELARVAARAWQPVESEALGGWTLRAAGGFTRRANSVLPVGDPGVPLDGALARVREWYGERGLPPYVQVATGAAGTQEVLGAELTARGWVREVTAEVWTGALAPVGELGLPGSGGAAAPVRLTRSVDTAWLRRYQRTGEPGPQVLKVLEAGPSVWFATVPAAGEDAGDDARDGTGGGDVPAAIGRCVVDGRWAGFMAVEVAPERRRRGLAGLIMGALARQALDEGASAAWLQVEADNTGARALYEGMGFAAHHSYHHFRSP
ncbi:GNAT family N-acetyltransferase [Streptomyces sp. NPDC050504]|uniref:GNAT family N-acetyltransferase n=1 Tax=Streptomyces sp. NPDC050504 TaxID=3365618 RepID=UPI0037B4AFF4